jgi:hypothetical protein
MRRSLVLILLLWTACDDNLRPPGQGDVVEFDGGNYFDGNWNPEGQGVLIVEPESLVFQALDLGEPVRRDIMLTNTGDRGLVIFELEPEGPGAENIEIDDSQLPIGLQPGDQVRVNVVYIPTSSAPLEANLQILWSDDRNPKLTVPMEAIGLVAELMVTPEVVAMGRIGGGVEVSREVTVQNDGRFPLELNRIELSGSPSFSLTQIAEGGERVPFSLGEGGELRAAEPLRFDVTYFSDSDVPESGVLHVSAQDGDQYVEVPLSANQRECPVAVGRATLVGGTTAPTDSIFTRPLETLQLDASASYDPDRALSGYRWRVLERPNDSTAQIAPSTDVPNPTFFLDLAGTYTFELTVFDDDGLESCNAALVTVRVVPDEALHVQLVWHTPNDPNETDNFGADLDLHLMRIPGEWDTAPWDCHWKNMAPDWGVQGSGNDDPSLDIDDVDGAGPENINLDMPQEETIYAVGVHLYSDREFGPSYATIRVFIHGNLVFERTNQELARTGFFWDVARIDWAAGEVELVDDVYSFGFP